ncbi:MAG: peroxidase family protein [Geminicoccaceae bacterium]
MATIAQYEGSFQRSPALFPGRGSGQRTAGGGSSGSAGSSSPNVVQGGINALSGLLGRQQCGNGNGNGANRDQLVQLIQSLIEVIDKIILELQGEPYDGSNPRSIDGTGNNVAQPGLGAVDTASMRMMPAEYADGTGSPAGADRPGAREISNAVVAQGELTGNVADASDMFWQWGQFIDHDLTLNHTTSPENMDISIPVGDLMYNPSGPADQWMPFTRSTSEADSTGQQQQVNSITAFLDGSQVYGSTTEAANALRSFEGGHLRTSTGDLLPVSADTGLFVGGDERAAEQPGLTAMHTVFMREHNRIADELAAKNPQWGDEQLYQAAREKVIAEIEVITYQEFLPILLGSDALPQYSGYDASVDPRISSSFASAAFRFGHSMVSPEIRRLDANGQSLAGGPLEIKDAFFNSTPISQDGIDPYLRGLASHEAQELDEQIIDPLRNMLFGAPGAGGLDLAALNIQRGRDHGIPSWNDAREALGLPRIESFDDPSLRDGAGAKLAEVYSSVDDVDLWVGGLSEKAAGGGLVGETFRAILVDQFTRTRDGDRYWYQNQYSGAALRELERTTLADVIERNSGVQNLQDEVMKVA